MGLQTEKYHYRNLPLSMEYYELESIDCCVAVVNLAHPPTRSYLKITNHSFQYPAPSLWNELPTDLRDPKANSAFHPSGVGK